jgi:hypothetical protein
MVSLFSHCDGVASEIGSLVANDRTKCDSFAISRDYD